MTSTIKTGNEGERARTALAVGAAIIIVLAVAAVGIASSWPADGWAAAAAWLTAGVAGIAGLVALGQLGEARRLRFEQAQPYVVAYMEPSGAGRFFLDLVIRNFGTTAAHDIRVTIDPPPSRHVQQGERVWLPESIPVLVPGQEWRTFWDSGQRWEGELPDRHEAQVRFSDSHGRQLGPLRSILDWSAHKNQRNLEVYGPHDAAKALREINTTLAKWRQPGHQGLAVTAWDGDAADQRRNAAYEARQAAEHELPAAEETP